MKNWWLSDGSVNRERLDSWEAVTAFQRDEGAHWRRLSETANSAGVRVLAERQTAALLKLAKQLQSARFNNHLVTAVDAIVEAYDGPSGTLIGTGSRWWRDRDDMKDASSSEAASFRAGMRRGVLSLADARDPQDFVGALWDVAPGLANMSRLAEMLQKERESARQSVRRLIDEAKRKDLARMDEWEEKLQEARAAYVGWARRRSTRWGQLTRSWEERHLESERRIRSVEETYKEQLGLKAPVDYWKKKAAAHRASEGTLRWLVIGFFAIAMAAVTVTFWNVGWTLINLAITPGAAPVPSGVYVVTSAGLGSAAAVLFWGGRLLTKLYLSQHHLRQDAEERATMTETYLALIENQAASTDDRQVILNALFRNTPDGIVKEEGGLDPSLAAALGRVLSR